MFPDFLYNFSEFHAFVFLIILFLFDKFFLLALDYLEIFYLLLHLFELNLFGLEMLLDLHELIRSVGIFECLFLQISKFMLIILEHGFSILDLLL